MSIFLFSMVALIAIMIFCTSFTYLLLTKDPAGEKKEEVEGIKVATIVGDRFRILTDAELIDELDLQASINNIKLNLGLSNENWQTDALPFLKQYIAFVQRLPASQSHHHAGDGGLIKHTLDVASLALIASTDQSWPPNAKTEDIAQQTAVWRYGILCAAILHDVGKVLTSFRIQLFTDAESHEYSIWMPDAGSMTETGKHFYRVEFPSENEKSPYSKHGEIAWAFFQALVPSHVRQWIASSDSELMIVLRSYLSGSKDGRSPLHKLITDADKASTARDLKTGSRQRFATAKIPPFIETLMGTFLEMLSNRGTYFSIAKTSGGDLFRRGEIVYMVAKNVPDKIREYLRKTNNPAAGAFPQDNQRIFDTFMEYGIVLPALYDDTKAITRIVVSFLRGDGEVVNQDLTVLQFPVSTLYPDGSYPDEFQGKLNIHLSQNGLSKDLQSDQNFRHEASVQKTDTVAILNNENSSAQGDKNKLSSDITPCLTTESTLHDDEELPSVMDKQQATVHEETSQQDVFAALGSRASRAPISLDLSAISDLNQDPNWKTKNSQGESIDPPVNKDFAEYHVSKSVTPTSSKKAGLSRIKAIWENPEIEVVNLNEKDTAQAGMLEIQHSRSQYPISSPRPVFVSNNQGLDEHLPNLVNQLDSGAEKPEDHALVTNSEQLHPSMQDEIKKRKSEITEDGSRFLNWLADKLAKGDIPINSSDATIHFVPQGMLLVSPKIFSEYSGGVFKAQDYTNLGFRAQKGFEYKKLHRRSETGTGRTSSTNLFKATGRRNNGGFLFTCYLIPEEKIKHIIQPSSRPQNNIDIELVNYDLTKLGGDENEYTLS